MREVKEYEHGEYEINDIEIFNGAFEVGSLVARLKGIKNCEVEDYTGVTFLGEGEIVVHFGKKKVKLESNDFYLGIQGLVEKYTK